MSTKFNVLVVRYGWITVDAQNERDAMDIVNREAKYDNICWADDWEAVDVDIPEDNIFHANSD